MNTIAPRIATQNLLRIASAPPSGGSSPAPAPVQDSFLKSYGDNVKANFNKDGVGWTLLASGAYGFGGGLLGGIGGALLGSVLPAPVGPFVANTMQMAGAVGGFLHRLGRKPE